MCVCVLGGGAFVVCVSAVWVLVVCVCGGRKYEVWLLVPFALAGYVLCVRA